MDEFLKYIDAESKVSYESQIALWLYDVMISKNSKIKFEESLITENLIACFNNFLLNEKSKDDFREMIKGNQEVITYFLTKLNNEPWNYVKPVIWSNNVDNQYFIENLTLSHRFEIYIDCKFKNIGIDIGLYYGKDGQHNGECEFGIEIKRDIMSKKTGNLYIEYQERHYVTGDWVYSGIFKNDNTKYFLAGDIDGYWILEKKALIDLYNEIKMNNDSLSNGCRLVGARRGTSLGFIIPKNVADTMSLDINDLI